MSEGPTFSIIIPTWNGQDYIDDCLTAVLAQQAISFEIIVVDNASTDGTADRVAAQYPAVHLIRHEQNRGFAGGCNAGLRIAQGQKLVLLNQDTKVDSDWLEAMALALERPEVGVIGCKITYADGQTIQHAGGWIEWPLGLAHHYGQGEANDGSWDEARPVEFVTGAAMAFRRQILDEVGFLDEGFWPGYFEDTDFCLRVREAHYEVWYIPQAQLSHVESTSITDPQRRAEIYERGRLRFILKHLSPDRFLHEFAPAEETRQLAAVLGDSSRALRLAYPAAIADSGSILYQRWRANPATIDAVVRALTQLHRLAWVNDWQKVDVTVLGLGPVTLPADLTELKALTVKPLDEFNFESKSPFFGSLIARLRWLWYSVAARWAIRFLTQQQEGVNQQQSLRLTGLSFYVQSLERRIRDLADQNAFLAGALAELSRKVEASKHDKES